MSDTTEEYIEMSSKASEIQEAWTPSIGEVVRGDFVGFISNRNHRKQFALKRFGYDKKTDGKYAWYDKSELTFLPRQEDLQGMFEGKYDLINMFVTFVDWAKGTLAATGEKYKEGEFDNFKTMEQLWLAFVMSEKYSKQWNSEKKDWEGI